MRLIDADVLMQKIETYLPTFSINPSKIIELVENAPTVERPHGKWITEPHSRIIHCSNCGAEENRNKLYLAKWCYSCGADMRPREGEE